MRRVSEIVRYQHPLLLPPETTVRHACQRMRQRKVGAVLVADADGRLLGIFTGRDAVGRVLAEGRDPEKTAISDVMTANPRTVPPGHSAIDALRLMFNAGCRHIPIIENDRVVGVVSKADFLGLELDRLDEETGVWERR
ncbi:MAG TPA: CBS domain-containing protein [Stellaceae bacterium]|jgi:CBS domain-containing protein|nr:CBS domain-containing protein [Stellaceae bacterium]